MQVISEIQGRTGHTSQITPLMTAREIYKGDGVRGFYKGLDAAIARQLLYSTTRIGVFTTLSDYIKAQEGYISPGKKILAALTAGFIGSIFGMPADVALVRMQADSLLPPLERRNYTSFFNAFHRIFKEEGVLTLWKGSAPTIFRGMAVNLGQLATYDEVRERLNMATGTIDTASTRLTAAGTSGFLAAFLSLPFDNIKTKLQKMKADSLGIMPYKGLSDCFAKSIKREGFLRLWVGFGSFYLRTGPHVMIVMLTQDIYSNWYKNKNKN